MPESLHRFLLARLDATPAPIIRLRELVDYPESSRLALLRAGVLVETERAELIEASAGRWLRVQHASDRFVGFDESEVCPSPEPLASEALTQFRISVPALLAHLRTVNGIDGRATAEVGDKLFAVGRKQMPGGPVVHVWLALALRTTAEITARLALLAQENAHATHVVIFPIWPQLPPTTVAALSHARVLLADLESERLCFRWPAELQTETTPDLPDYALLADGATWRIHFLGDSFTIRAVKGVLLLARLLEDPSKAWTPLELERGYRSDERYPTAADEDGLVVAEDIESSLEAADPKQLAIYRQELARLQRQLAQAEAEGREVEIAEAGQELADWQARMDEAVGLGGRSRMSGAKERARKNISKLIDEALDRVAKENVRVGEHLRRRVRLGSALTYTPEPGEVWRVRFPAKK